MLILFYFIIGICIGSFFNVVIYRMPLGKSVNFPASHCPKCKHKLKFYHNIPIFSWIFLKGSCAFCKEKISIQYPTTELIGGLSFVLALFLCDFEVLRALFLGLFFITLYALAFMDFKFSAVPEIPLVLSYFFALGASYKSNLIENFVYGSPLVSSLIFAGGIVMLKSLTSAWINRHNTGEIQEAMGDADTIIIASIGALFGGLMGLVCIVIGSVLQLVFHIILRNKQKEAPFIPALGLGILICFVFDEQISMAINSYLNLVGIK